MEKYLVFSVIKTLINQNITQTTIAVNQKISLRTRKKIVCSNCGTLQGYEYVKEYIDFHQNYHKMKRKSVYHRKYHINNKLLDIKQKYNIELSYQQQIKIEKIFSEIGQITDQINNGRKRLISINFILIQILKNMDLPFENIPISKSKKKH